MATTVESLLTRLRGLIGDEDSANYRYTDANLRDVKFQLGIERLNDLGWPQQYRITGTGSAKEFDPDPDTQDEKDLQAIVVASALVIAEGEMHKYANAAYSISNPAGRTDFTKISEALGKRADDLRVTIGSLLNQRMKTNVEKDMTVEELKSSPVSQTEGLGITIIERTV